MHSAAGGFVARTRSAFALSVVLGLISALFLTPSASAARKPGPVILLIANYLSLDDLRAAGPNTQRLLSDGAVALMNTGLGREPARVEASLEDKSLAVGSGVRLLGSDGRLLCRESQELVRGRRAGDIWSLETGRRALPGSIVCLGVSRLLRANVEMTPGGECLGALGEGFRSAGLRTAVIGSSDLPGEPVRWAPLVAMDRYGYVDSGALGEVVTRADGDSPCGMSDDVTAISSLAREYSADHGLIVIELGDPSRVEWYRPRITDPAYAHYRDAALVSLDSIVGEMRSLVEDTSGALVLCSPRRSQAVATKSNLSPVLLYKPGGVAGVLLSPTTRTPGLISNVDVCPTVLSLAGLDIPRSIVGIAAHSVHRDNAVDDLLRTERIAVRNYGLQIPVLVTVGAIVLLCVTGLELFLYRNARNTRARRIFSVVLMWMSSLPATFVLVDGSDTAGTSGYVLNLLVVSALLVCAAYGIAGLLSRLGGDRRSLTLGMMFTLTTMLLVIDVATGAHLLRWTILSCDHITGIRYYGLGNEYMGVLVGAALLGPVLLLRALSRGTIRSGIGFHGFRVALTILMIVWFGTAGFVIGYPKLGANVGGLLTAVAAFGVAFILLCGRRLRRWHGLALTATAFGVVALFAAIDMSARGGTSSHLGNSISRAETYGWQTFAALIVRKLSMHLGILRLPQAYYPVLFSIPFFLMYGGRLKSELAETGNDVLFHTGMPAALIGAVVAFLFNDSGIVPAALIAAIFVTSALFVRLGEVDQ